MNRPAIILIMRDPPETEARKGGLFPTAIRHHIDLGLEVHVASLSPMTPRHHAVLRDLGAQALTPAPQDIGHRLGALFGRPPKPEDILTSPAVIDRIGVQVPAIAVTGLQSYHSGMVARTIAQRLGVPYVTWEHLSTYQTNGTFRHSDGVMAAFFSQSHATAVVSPGVAQAIRARFGIDLPQARVVPNPIPLGFADEPGGPPPAWITEFAHGRRLIGTWTSWRQLKRIDVMLDAFALLHAKQPDTGLVIAGPMRDDSQAVADRFLADHPQLSEAICFAGNLDRVSIRHLAATVRCCCVASDQETFGLQIVESLAVGTPVVATRCGGPEFILDAPGLGQLCARNDPKDMARALEQVLENPDDFDKTAIAAHAERHYGPEAQKDHWRAVYTGLLPSAPDTPRERV